MNSKNNTILLLSVFLLFSPAFCFGLENPENVTKQLAPQDLLGSAIDLTLKFKDETGKELSLGDLAHNKPLIIAPVYFECPRLCSLTQQGLVDVIKQVDLKIGEDYQLASVSFDPTETPEFAQKKAETYHAILKEHPQIKSGWKFLTGENSATEPLMKQIGFSYEKDKEEFAHAAMIVLITPDGRISKYFYGIKYLPNDFRLGLIDASEGRIGNIVDKIMLYCFRYDHLQGRYTLVVMNLVRIVGVLSFLLLSACLIWLRMKEKGRLR